MKNTERHPAAPWRNLYGRGKGKPLRPRQIWHMDETYPQLALPQVGWDENPARVPLNLGEVFGDDRPIWLEIGFGGGEHLLALATANPDIGFIGVEPFLNGMAMLVPRVDAAGLRNVRLHLGDGRDVLDILPAESVARAFLLYPDPWPKLRHHRRRFVKPENIDPLARVLTPGARFHVATDIEDYVRHTLEHMSQRPDFTWTAQTATDWRSPWSDWHSTRYEQKALRAGRRPHYLTFMRAGDA